MRAACIGRACASHMLPRICSCCTVCPCACDEMMMRALCVEGLGVDERDIITGFQLCLSIATFAAFFRPSPRLVVLKSWRSLKFAALGSVCKQLLQNNTEPTDWPWLAYPTASFHWSHKPGFEPCPTISRLQNTAPQGPPNVVYCGQNHPLGIMISQTQKQHSSSWQPALHCSSDPSRWPDSEHPRVRKVGVPHRHDASQTASRETRADHKLTHLSVLHIHLGKRHNLPRIT